MNAKQKIAHKLFAAVVAGLLFIANTNAQVTIGSSDTPTPGAVLDLSKVSSKDLGIMLPQVSLTNLSTWAPLTGTAVNGMLVYNTNAGTGSGIYYWKDGNWVVLASATASADPWSITGNSGTDPAVNFIGTTDNHPLKFKVSNTFAGYLGTEVDLNTSLGTGTNNPSSGVGGWGNTAIGTLAMQLNATGGGNSAIGSRSLGKNTTGSLNTAIGIDALTDNSTGECNTAVGAQALQSNTEGKNNSAIGFLALDQNTTGSNNIALGTQALRANQTGEGNVAIGNASLLFSNASSKNIAIGQWALQGIKDKKVGDENIGVGWGVMSQANDVNQSVAIGTSALDHVESGGSGSVAIGFQAGNSNISGILTAVGWKALDKNTTGAQNTGIGHNALQSNTIGMNNTAVGAESLVSNTEGNHNTAIGLKTMFYNKKGNYNTAIGVQTMVGRENSSTIGEENVALGSGALYLNSGNKNTAAGTSALWNNEIGEENVAMGNETLSGNIDGSWNTAVGTRAMWSICNECRSDGFPEPSGHGVNNSAFGYEALRMITTGKFNTGIGSQTLHETTEASYNVAIGNNALYNHKKGDANIAIGVDALNRDSIGRLNIAIGYKAVVDKEALRGEGNIIVGNYTDHVNEELSNAIIIGSHVMATASNQVVIGNDNVTSIGSSVGWSTLSDQRIEANVQENVPGLAFITNLRPVTYNLDLDAVDNIQNNQRPPVWTAEELNARDAKKKIVYTGFVAQEVETAAKTLGYEFSGVDAPATANSLYQLRYSEFVVPLVKAIQELNAQNAAKDAAIASLQKQIDELKNK